jgi:hypothetical protein
MDTLLAHILGYTFAILVAHWPIWLISKRLWDDFVPKGKKTSEIRPRAWHPALVGIMERGLYVAALQNNAAEFIGVWLAIKVASQWKGWSEGIEEKEVIITGRELANTFMIGNGLSLTYAFIGSQLISWLLQDNIRYAIQVSLLILIATGLLYGIILLLTKKREA